MKIVYVYPQLAHLAGTERILIDKMNYLADLDGYEVYIVTHEQGVHLMAYLLSPKIKHIDLDVRLYSLLKKGVVERLIEKHLLLRLLQRRYNKLISEIKPDVVITVTYYAYLLSVVASCSVRCSKILESHIDKKFIHNNSPSSRQSLRKRLKGLYDMNVINKRSSKFDVLVALHQKDADDWSRYLKTKVITNIVHLNDTGRYCSLESKRVIFVGRYIAQKGIPDLFDIWQIVYRKHPDWHLHLYGDGNIRDVPYSEYERLRINIHVHRSDPHIFERYLESSIFVLTSLYEPFGLVMPEAMSFGLPVVAFDCPAGPASIITDGVDGFLIRNRDIHMFADAISRLIESPQLRLSMGKAGIQSSQKYSPDKIMSQWTDLFKELTTSPKP